MLIQRLQQFIEHIGISTFAFEKSIGYTNNTIRKKLVSGRSNMGTDTLIAILEKYPQLSADWLLLGKGSMLREDNSEQAPQKETSDLTDALQIINKQQDSIKELTKAVATLIENSTRL